MAAQELALDAETVLPLTGWRDPMQRTPNWYRKDGTLGWMGPRVAASRCIRACLQAAASSKEPALPVFDDIYEFGVYTGGGLREWFRQKMNTSRTRVFGFDSFQGMPDNDATDRAAHINNPAWRAGGLNAAEQLHLASWSQLRDRIVTNIGYEAQRIRLIRGFYNESLVRRNLAQTHQMGPARLLDLDCDLASSTRQALQFMLREGLLRPGSFVYYDDASEKMWTSSKASEQTLAHREVSKEYGLTWQMLRCKWPKSWHWRAVLRLTACQRCPVTI